MGEEVKVISFGGSILAPDRVDVELLRRFRAAMQRRLARNGSERYVTVVGGGAPAREYQRAYRDVVNEPDHLAEDWVGIAATRLNAQLMHAALSPWSGETIVIDPTRVAGFGDRILVAGGWKPGFSTDYVAVLLAERFGARSVINLSNITHVFSSDPRTDPSAKPLARMKWSELRALVGDRWTPGKNAPFDPVASERAEGLHLRVVVAAGSNIDNLEAILDGREFEGTTIGPD